MVATVAAVFTSNLTAGEPLLSPRAQANETRTMSTPSAERIDRANQFSHRGDLVAATIATGATSERDLVRESRDMTGSPRMQKVFPRLAQTGDALTQTGSMACPKSMKKGECSMACCKDTATHCSGGCCKL